MRDANRKVQSRFEYNLRAWNRNKQRRLAHQCGVGKSRATAPRMQTNTIANNIRTTCVSHRTVNLLLPTPGDEQTVTKCWGTMTKITGSRNVNKSTSNRKWERKHQVA